MTSLLQLPPDVLDVVLMSISEFKTLRACILTCKSMHNVYKYRPASITSAVARNLLSSRQVLAAALRGVRAERCFELEDDDYDEEDFDHAQYELPDELRDSEQDMLKAPLTWREAQALDERAAVCNRFEVIYSATAKDRTTGETSRLSPEESHALQKVLHRTWLFFDVVRFHPSLHTFWDTLEKRRQTFYDALDNQELWELNETWRFLANTYAEMPSAALDPPEFFKQFGLKGFVKLYDTDSFDFFRGDFDINFSWDDDFRELWVQRNVTEWDQGAPKGCHHLLTSTVGSMDRCPRCDCYGGLHLFNRSNWHYLRRLRDLSGYWMNLPDNLRANRRETVMLQEFLQNHPMRRAQASDSPPPSLGDILADLFELPNVISSARMQQEMVKDGFSVYTPDDWLCDGCVHEFLIKRQWIWWYYQKVQGRVLNEIIREDCWYGYECRTQTHKLEHAAKLNHLCVNTYAERQALRLAGRAAANSATGQADASQAPASDVDPSASS